MKNISTHNGVFVKMSLAIRNIVHLMRLFLNEFIKVKKIDKDIF
jgi:hypothetical protein